MMAAEWRVYYKGGTTISSEDMDPRDVPGLMGGHGVLVITQRDHGQDKSVLLHGTGLYLVNWYWWDTNEQWWIGGDDAGLIMYLSSPGWKKVLPGETAPPEEWRRTIKQAMNDHLGWDETDLVET